MIRATAVRRAAVLCRRSTVTLQDRSHLRDFATPQRAIGSLSSWMPWFLDDENSKPVSQAQKLNNAELLERLPEKGEPDHLVTDVERSPEQTPGVGAPNLEDGTDGNKTTDFVETAPSLENSPEGEDVKELVNELATMSKEETGQGMVEGLGKVELLQSEHWYDFIINVPIHLLLSVNEATGLPWWGTIAATTVLVRAVALPITIYTMKGASNVSKIQEPLKEKTEAYQAAVKAGNRELAQQRRVELKKFREKHGATTLRLLIGPLVQAPLFLSFFVAIRRLAHNHPELATGGAYWFSDLSSADPTYVLPVLASVTLLGMLEVGGESGKVSPGMKNVLRGMAVVFIPATCKLSSAIFMYWIPNNIIGATTSIILKRQRVRYLLGFKDVRKDDEAHNESLKPIARVSHEDAVLSYLRAKNPRVSLDDLKKQNLALLKTPVSRISPRQQQRQTSAE